LLRVVPLEMSLISYAGRKNREHAPLQIVRTPVVQVDGFPKRIIAWVECSSLHVELVREYQLPVGPILYRLVGEGVVWSVGVDERKHRLHHLTCGIDAPEVERSEVGQPLGEEVGEDWESGEKDENSSGKDNKASQVCETTRRTY
jgi:hypothetical protein